MAGMDNVVEPVPEEVVKKALAFAIQRYTWHRDFGAGPKKALQKTWTDVQHASYGASSKFGYFIRYSHQISDIAASAQKIVEAERKNERKSRHR